MSGIYGIIRFDGAPVEPEALATMRGAMAYYGPDGGGEYCKENVGLGHLLLKVTPEDSFESQPVKNENITLVTYARLDNRDELVREFNIPVQEQSSMPDSGLVMRAYRRWGERCPDHINGDWQFAVWDKQRKTLFIARDHFGNTGLYYYRNTRFIAFASSIKALLALSEVPCRPDMIKVAQVLTAWLGEGWRTAYEDLYRLPPAHTLRVDGTSVENERYWHPEKFATIRYKDDHEYVDHFLHLYTEAIRSRLRSARPIATTLSGGLDSGSVVALAAPMLASAGKSLAAFTSVPAYDISAVPRNRTGDEWLLASAVAQMAGDNIEHIPLQSKDISLIFAIENQINIHDEPGHAASNHYWIEDVFTQAQARSIGTILTGQFGNFTASFNGSGSLRDAFHLGGWRSASRLFRYGEPDPWLTVKRQILKPLLLPGLKLYRYYVKEGGIPWKDYSAIKSSFATKIQLGRRMNAYGHDPTFTMRSSILEGRQMLLETSIGARWHETGAAFGMAVCDPTADRSIIEYCFKVPDEQYRRRGENRWLIRRAMAGLMPPEVLNNQKRGLQAADLQDRVRFSLAEIRMSLERIEKSELVLTCLDMPKMFSIMQRIENNVREGIDDECTCILLRGLGVGQFLTRF